MASRQPAISKLLKAETAELHRRAERSRFVRDCLRGTLPARAWAQFLAELLPMYLALEDGLRLHGQRPYLDFLEGGLPRAARLRQDLVDLRSPELRGSVGLRAAAHIERFAKTAPHRLLGHAYARYFGDLMGGQMMARAMAPVVDGVGTSWLEFESENPKAVVAKLRVALDEPPWGQHEREHIIEEARWAFAHAIEVFESVTEPFG